MFSRKRKSADSTLGIPSAPENASHSAPDYHLTMKVVDILEIPPSPDDVLVCVDMPGTFQFAHIMECGITPFILIRRRLKNGGVDADMHTAYAGTVYFRDLAPRTPRERLPEPEKHRSNIRRHALLQPDGAEAEAETATPSEAAPKTLVKKHSRRTKTKSPETTTPKRRGRPRKSVA